MKKLLLLVLLVPAGACGAARAQTATEPVLLEVPPAPPRVIEALPPDQLARPEPVADLPPAPATATPARPRPQPAREPARTEPKPDPPAETPPPPPASPVPQLRTPATADSAEALRKIREVLDRASRNLGQVDDRALNNERRAQFETARLFMQQAEEALKVSNYVYAEFLAGKADTIAKELLGRN